MDTSVEGSIEQFYEFADLLGARKESGRLVLNNGQQEAQLFFDEGRLVHAQAGETTGDSAVYEALSWKVGRFSFTPGSSNGERTIDEAQELLLFETMDMIKSNGDAEVTEVETPRIEARPKVEVKGGGMHSIALPEGESVHENLKSAFVELPKLLDDLAKSEFSGYLISRSDSMKEGLILFFRGLVSDVYYYKSGQVFVGTDAMDLLLSETGEGKATINVRKLDEEFVASFASLFYGKTVHSGLDAKAVKIRGLVESLENDQFTGSVNVQIPDESTEGFVFLFEGRKLGVYYRSGGEMLPGVTRVYKMTSLAGATIRVLETPPLSEIKAGVVLHSTNAENLKPLIRATQLCVQAMSKIAGPDKAAGLFDESRDQAVKEFAWLTALKWNDDQDLHLEEGELPPLDLEEAVSAFLSVMNGCWEQGREIFGEKMARSALEKELKSIRPEIEALGVPVGWPE